MSFSSFWIDPFIQRKQLLLLAVLGPPTIALIYALSVWVTYALSHEFSWTSKIGSLILPASAIFTAAIAVCSSSSSTIDDEIQPPDKHLTSIVFFFGMSSIYCIYKIRKEEVVGISTIPLYGKDHLRDKVILITGANAGIGKETAAQLVSMGAKTIVLLCRSESRAQAAIHELVADRGGFVDSNQFQFCSCDLGDFDSIRKAVRSLTVTNVDILINNAGLVMGTHTKSKDGYELMMQANHLGHFLLTQLLLDRGIIRKDGNSRIINLTSSTYKLVKSGFDFQDMFCEGQRNYTMFGQYSQTKLANILYTKELARRYPTLSVYAVHPGIVRTNVTSNMIWYLRLPNDIFSWYVAALQKTPAQGAYSSVYCAASPLELLPKSGSVIHNCKSHKTTDAAESRVDAQRLWNVSETLTGMSKESK